MLNKQSGEIVPLADRSNASLRTISAASFDIHHSGQGLLIVFALLSSNMFALLLGWIFEFLSLRGVVDVGASRVALVGAWISGVVIIAVWVWGGGIGAKWRTLFGGAVLLGGMLWGLDKWAPKPSAIAQRFLPELKIGRMVETLWIGKGQQILLLHDGSFEARGFAKQIDDVLEAAQWKVIGNGDRFPFTGTNSVMTISGAALDDPAILSLQAAFAIAGFDVRYKPGGKASVLLLEF